jgi:hypothetical protein
MCHRALFKPGPQGLAIIIIILISVIDLRSDSTGLCTVM